MKVVVCVNIFVQIGARERDKARERQKGQKSPFNNFVSNLSFGIPLYFSSNHHSIRRASVVESLVGQY